MVWVPRRMLSGSDMHGGYTERERCENSYLIEKSEGQESSWETLGIAKRRKLRTLEQNT
jgi:hypothetical protein